MCECACVFVGLEPYLGSLRPWMFMRWLSICRESSGCVFGMFVGCLIFRVTSDM